MAEMCADDLGKADRQKLTAVAREAGCSVEAMGLAIITSYLHLLDTAEFVLPKSAPGVSLKRMGGR